MAAKIKKGDKVVVRTGRDKGRNGEVLQVGMGGVARLAMVHSQGIAKPDMTPEDIAENLEAIMDVAGARVTASTLGG